MSTGVGSEVEVMAKGKSVTVSNFYSRHKFE